MSPRKPAGQTDVVFVNCTIGGKKRGPTLRCAERVRRHNVLHLDWCAAKLAAIHTTSNNPPPPAEAAPSGPPSTIVDLGTTPAIDVKRVPPSLGANAAPVTREICQDSLYLIVGGLEQRRH